MLVRRLVIVAISAITVVMVLFSAPVRAQDAGLAQGIQISPVLIDLNAEKGNNYTLKITVTNVTTHDLVLKSNVNDFRAKDESGNPEVILDDKDTDPTFSFKSWVKPIANLNLKAQESKVVSVDVSVPAGAEAGGHYGVIRFSGNPPSEENNNVSIAASVGVLLLTRVNGTITESLKFKEIFIEKNGKQAGLIQNGPFTISERLENDGNVHVKPTGTVTIKNMFGGTTASIPVNDPPKNVLPKSIRKLSQTVNKKWLFGRYTARADLTYGYSGKVLTGTTSFWVIPYKLISIVLVALALLIVLFRWLIQKHNARIIAQAYGKPKR